MFQIQAHESSKTFAAKLIDKQKIIKEKQKLKLKSEIRIHRALHHPNVIRFRHVFEDKRYVYILMDLSEHHSLSEFLKKRKRFCELEVKFFMN